MKKIKVINIVAISLAFAMISSCTSTNVSAPSTEQEEVVENRAYEEKKQKIEELKHLRDSGILSEEEYKETFGSWIHPFTGLNMVDFYRELVKSENCEIEFVFSNDPKGL